MIDNNLLEYIRLAQQQGHTKEMIKQSLVANGWQGDMVEEAFGMVHQPVGASAAQSTISAQPIIRHYKSSINSPLSVLLAIVLAVALFTLTNKVITDISDFYVYNITANLIVNGVIVLTFLLLAFTLHFTIGEKNEKYLILSRPYYLISGWLLIRLLYEVSKYLLNQDTAYGVYVVLILIIAVLTGMVVFVQKFIKK